MPIRRGGCSWIACSFKREAAVGKKEWGGQGGLEGLLCLMAWCIYFDGSYKNEIFFCKVTLKCRGAEEGAQISLTKKIIGGITLILMF